MFEKELDRYESSLSPLVGPSAAHEARREMALHLDADYAARIEIGGDPDAARIAALEAIGDLEAIAREEQSPSRSWGEIGLAASAALLWTGWSIPGLNGGTPRMILTLAGVAVPLTLSTSNARSDRSSCGALAWVMASVVPILVFALYRIPLAYPASSMLALSTIGIATAGSLILGAIRRRTIWRLGLVAGTAIFLTQTLCVELSLRRVGSHPGYPLDQTVGTWAAFTLPLLILSAIGARATTLVERGLVCLREVSR